MARSQKPVAEGLRLLPRAEQFSVGKRLRAQLPRSGLAELPLSPRRNAIATLCAQNASRIAELVPIRRERMSESPFAFFRGAAAVMAHDLAASPTPGLKGQICGDAHLSNFGVFAGRDRDLVFDLNDFDETSIGPFEWDLKRLAASLVILADDLGLKDAAARKAAEGACRTYREAIAALAAMSITERLFTGIAAAEVLQYTVGGPGKERRSGQKFLRRTARNNSMRVLSKLAVRHEDGRYHIEEQPPLTTHLPGFDSAFVESIFALYQRSVPEFIGNLLASMRIEDQVVRVVGVGSVGTRCLLILLTDPDGNPLFLQAKQALASVLEASMGPSGWPSHSQRVVAGQRILQATGDPFLGHFDLPDGDSYYVRQFRDMKGSIDLDQLAEPSALIAYGRVCAIALARAHAQSGTPGAIAGYFGQNASSSADGAVADFAFAYRDVNKSDHQALLDCTARDWYQPTAAASHAMGDK